MGELIANTYSRFNLSFATPGELAKLLGPFQHAGSADPVYRDAIAQVLRAPMVYVAEGGGEIVGVLRGRQERLASLFVRADHQRRGIGRRLVERFEQESMRQGVGAIRVAATLHAIPFYTAMGYRKTTGVRNGWSFQGRGLRYQPMKKLLSRDSAACEPRGTVRPLTGCRTPAGGTRGFRATLSLPLSAPVHARPSDV